MNLAVRRFILFFFSLATLAACEDPTDIGINLQEDNKIGTDYTDTLTVKTGTVLLSDSVLSFKKVPALLGYVEDPALGTVKASYFTEVNINGTDLKFGENPVADSVVLTLDYRLLYGNGNNPVTIQVYELTESFEEKESYFTDSEIGYGSTVLGQKTIVPRILPHDLDGNGEGAKVDSARLIRIKLDYALAQKIVAESGKDPLKTQKNFINFLKGLALVATDNTSGQLIAINTASNTVIKTNQTALKLYYKNGTESKTHSFTLNGPDIRSFSKIDSDRSGTPVAGLQESTQYISSEQTSGESYVQAGTQLFTKLSIPYLDKLKEAHGDFVLNRAELVVPVKTGSTAIFNTPAQLVLYETNNSNRILKDENGNPRAVQLSSVGSIDSYAYPTAMVYDAEKNQYTVNITSYIQDVLLGKKVNNSLLLAPANLNPGNNGTSQISTEIFPFRAILNNTAANGVKLRVYFSKLN